MVGQENELDVMLMMKEKTSFSSPLIFHPLLSLAGRLVPNLSILYWAVEQTLGDYTHYMYTNGCWLACPDSVLASFLKLAKPDENVLLFVFLLLPFSAHFSSFCSCSVLDNPLMTLCLYQLSTTRTDPLFFNNTKGDFSLKLSCVSCIFTRGALFFYKTRLDKILWRCILTNKKVYILYWQIFSFQNDCNFLNK